MGLMVDTNVFIKYERAGGPIVFPGLAESEKAYISVVTVSELLVGVHRANTEDRRQRRAAFVEAVLSSVETLDITAAVARTHAELCAYLAGAGQMIGAHDLFIAATARFHNHSLLTDNANEFSRVPGLRVVPFAV